MPQTTRTTEFFTIDEPCGEHESWYEEANMRVIVDADACIGYGRCGGNVEVFELEARLL